ncbi:sensor histidine kinase [Rheinheimera sp. MMS21-TC3]|uniref:sensor histidine kinase n=1 Tax=Rheinheimera sp. MMS21-TC3 TaxID=3072790 RepID=UPI0028C3A72F|nr:histidine kinase [Rheinheimera sp. MMS21-TC3]WNO59603.1 histidine kinase [Rheinheimera sp. MMS21-TC3]
MPALLLKTSLKTPLLLSALVLATLLYGVMSFSQNFGENQFYNPLEHLMFVLYVLSSLVCCLLSQRLLKSTQPLLDWLNASRFFLLSSVLHTLICSVLFLLLRLLSDLWYGRSLALPSWMALAANALFALLMIHLLVLALYLAYSYLQQLHNAKLQQLQAERQAAQAQFKLLQQQITPHFLFNSLNVLTSLISAAPALAERYVTLFSSLYRFVLQHKDSILIPLQQELSFINQYLELMNIRFAGAYQLVIVPELEASNAQIAPGALQTCVENAVKHNIASPQAPLEIAISLQQGMLQVKNPLRPKVVSVPSGTGLCNLVERYQLLTSQPVQVEKTADEFKVIIPLLRQADGGDDAHLDR